MPSPTTTTKSRKQSITSPPEQPKTISCFSSLVGTLFFVFNFFLLTFGSSCICFAIIAWRQPLSKFTFALADNKMEIGVIGGMICFISIIGMFSVVEASPLMIKVYSFLTVPLLISQVTAAIYLLITQTIDDHLHQMWSRLSKADQFLMEERLECCGLLSTSENPDCVLGKIPCISVIKENEKAVIMFFVFSLLGGSLIEFASIYIARFLGKKYKDVKTFNDSITSAKRSFSSEEMEDPSPYFLTSSSKSKPSSPPMSPTTSNDKNNNNNSKLPESFRNYHLFNQ